MILCLHLNVQNQIETNDCLDNLFILMRHKDLFSKILPIPHVCRKTDRLVFD